MLMVTRVSDIEPDFVQARRPQQQLSIASVTELPSSLHVLEQRRSRRFYALRLIDVDVVPLLHRADCSLPRILVMQSTQHVVEQTSSRSAPLPISSCSIRNVLATSARMATPLGNTATIFAEPRQLELLEPLGLDHCLDDPFERRKRDAALEQSKLLRDIARSSTVPDDPIARLQPRRRKIAATGAARAALRARARSKRFWLSLPSPKCR